MTSTTTKSTPTSRKKVARMRETEKEREPLCRPHSIAFSLSLLLSLTRAFSLSLSLFQVIKDEKVPNATATSFPSFLPPPHRTRVLRRLRGCPRSLRGHIGLWRGRRPLKQPSKSSQLSRATFLVKARLFVQQLWKISSTSVITDCTSHRLLASNLNEVLFL